ncbi:MAG: hypothetical protein HC875_05725 [Anaerolineales bacterium]|nr:hypothetical protein [Anaerolineales bacterium]
MKIDPAMYAVQVGQFTEQGPVPNSGAIIRVKAGDASEVIMSGLSFPTSIDFNAAGDAYVSINGIGAPGSGQVVKYDGLTEQAGTPLPDPAAAAPAPAAEPAPATLPTSGGDLAASNWVGGLVAVLGVSLSAAGLVLKRSRFLFKTSR